MRAFHSLLVLGLALLSTVVAQESTEPGTTKYDYQSDVSRLRKIVINSLYSHRDVWLRELISNGNDALEKLRLTALTNKDIPELGPMNMTIKAVKDEEGTGGRIIITDSGIGMNQEDLAANLGTLAKSGTSEFLARAENSDATGTGNLIGAFGVGFYSSFLIADRVYVASRPPSTSADPNPVQHVFSSSADESSFEVYPDPRGNTLQQGTEITLILKEDASEYLENSKLMELVSKHSAFSSTFPIYLFTQYTEEVPEDESESEVEEATDDELPDIEVTEEEDLETFLDEDEVIVEDVEEGAPKETEPPKTKQVTHQHWVLLNPHPPLWSRDPKDVTDDEYISFYQATFKDDNEPIAWHHFSGDIGTGTSFKGLLYIPAKLRDAYWREAHIPEHKDVRLLVKHVFITSDFGDDNLPRWANWVKVIIDADDLPLNVSREMLQSSKFLKQIKNVIVKHLIQLISRLAEEDPEKFAEIQAAYATTIKVGAVEDQKSKDKLAPLARFNTTQRDSISLDEYVENKRKSQKQIYYVADVGKTSAQLKKSVFIEKLVARGYEVLLFSEPIDEILAQNLRRWKNMLFQDAAKAGLKFGDEGENAEEEKEREKELKEKFEPLIKWLEKESGGSIRNAHISNRLVTSSCAIVADTFGYSANVEKLMNAAPTADGKSNWDFMKKQKILEINPKSPLIEEMLHRVNALPAEEEEKTEEDQENEEELKEVTSILIDGALVRSGFEVHEPNEFFIRVDRVLRRSLGVSQSATTDATVRPAPPVDPEVPEEAEPDNYLRPELLQETFGEPRALRDEL